MKKITAENKKRTWTIRFRKTDRRIFDDIKKGLKTVETRAATVRYLPIKDGDEFICVCGDARVTKQIRKKRHFKSVDALLRSISFKAILPNAPTRAEAKSVFDSFGGYKEKLDEFGIFAFELK